MTHACLAALVAALTAGPALAQDTERRLTPEEIAALPSQQSASMAGVTSRVLLGDSAKPGPYAIAIDYPPGLEIKPHRHKDHRNAIIMRGSIAYGYGSVADRSKTKVLGVGGYYTEAAETPHYGFVGPEGLTLYLTGFGPSDTRQEK